MNDTTFFRAAVLAPLIVPLGAVGLAALAPELFLGLGIVLGGSLLLAGLPYVLFAAGLLWWARGRSSDSLRRAAVRAPLLFAPLGGIGVATFYLPPSITAGYWGYIGTNLVFGAVMCLVFGYGYVGAGLLVDRLRRLPSGPA